LSDDFVIYEMAQPSAMTDPGQTIERLSRAARPTLFYAACEPEILFALVLSNLMSPSLWAFRTTIEGNAALCGEGEPRAPMDAIQHYVNDHFFPESRPPKSGIP
jgi:hypothetical protein